MSQSVQVRSLDALGAFRTAMLRYRHEAEEALQGFDYYLGRTLEWVQERITHWQKDVRHGRDEVRFAELALGRCRSAGGVDANGFYRYPDCGRYEMALNRANLRLRNAEAGLAGTLQWEQILSRAIETFQKEERLLRDMLEENVPSALLTLETKLSTLVAYVSIAPPSEPDRPSLLPAHKGVIPALEDEEISDVDHADGVPP